ncbi:MAG: cysteine-rich repeat protein [Hyphomicrobiaceae bacterium]|jgi:cysteine-rich repeat protein
MAQSIPLTGRRLLVAFVGAAFLASIAPMSAQAHDDEHRRIGGDKLKIIWDAANPQRSLFLFLAKEELAINTIPFAADPTTEVSSLLVRGLGLNGNTTGVIELDPAGWKVARNGKTWSYKANIKTIQSFGVAKIKVKQTSKGGKIIIKAKGQSWDLPIVGEQDAVQIFLRVGAYSFCSEYSAATSAEFTRNELGRVQGKFAGLPLECDAVCGNGVLELGEDCDDGNLIDGDTCNLICEGCDPADVEFDSTFEGIQTLIFDNPVYGCSNDTCHGSALQGNLDLRDGTAWGEMVNVDADINPSFTRVFPGDQGESLLYLKLASATLGTPTAGEIPGSPMPLGGTPLTEEHLEAVKVWIRGGAPETGVVDGTAELLGSCLPAAGPNKMPQPDVPSPTEGFQLAMPGYSLPTQSETELCVASFYDLSAPGAVPAGDIVDCAGVFPGTNDHGGPNSGKCLAYSRDEVFQDPQSHHSIVHIYAGVADVDDPGWGNWRCYLGDNHNQTCDPSDTDPCPGGGVCGGDDVTGVACIGYGPSDYGFNNNNSPAWSGSQESTNDNNFPSGVYSVLPLRGLVVWNSHAFNLTTQNARMEAWINVTFTDQQTHRAQGLFNSDKIFTQDVLPFEQEEYCHTHTFLENTHLFSLSSHTHQHGLRWRYYLPPQTPCTGGGSIALPSCSPGSAGDIFYESFDYSDALELEFSPEMVFSGSTNDRTIKFCALYDNGLVDPSLVKLQSTSPFPPNPFTPGGPCDDNETRCVGGPNKGDLCNADDLNCPTSTCDACPSRGGVTTEDEMFIALGSYYVP